MLKLQLPIAYDVCVYIYIHTLTHTHIYLFYKLYSHLFFYLPHFLTISQSSWHVLTKCKLIYVIIRRENCLHRKKSNYFKLSRNWLLSYLMLLHDISFAHTDCCIWLSFVCSFLVECPGTPIRSDQSLSRVWLFETPWIAARQASLSITNSRSSLRLTSIESVMPSSHLILCRPLLLLPPITPSIRVFSNESLYSIGPCFYHQSHPPWGILFALAPSLHSFWSYFSTDLQ